MKNFYDWARDLNIEVPEKEISGAWFYEHRLPMVVRCICCDMTMALPSAWIDEDGDVFCSICADVKEK